MKSNYRPGSEGAAQEKATRRFFIGATVIVSIVYLLFFIPLPNNFFHGYFLHADIGWKIIGVISAGGWYWFLWRKSANIFTGVGDRGSVSILLLVWFALNIALLAGWKFDL